MRRDAPFVLVAFDLMERLWIPAPAKCGRRVWAPSPNGAICSGPLFHASAWRRLMNWVK